MGILFQVDFHKEVNRAQEMKEVVIIGAGPAGLTAAYELLKKSKDYHVIILEQDNQVGGISKTVNYKGNRMDIGGHRFFSKVPEINAWWEEMLPVQGAPSYDDKYLGRNSEIKKDGPDPELENDVMLCRHRLSHILFDGKFYDYPINPKIETIKNLGIISTLEVGLSYLKSQIKRRAENSLEDFYVNRFGYKLYSMFFEYYTENLWGRHPSNISADWGSQRVKGLSISEIIRDMIFKALGIKRKKIETSLIDDFKYPKYGPGQMWECTARKILDMGGEIRLNTHVVGVSKNDKNEIESVSYIHDEYQDIEKCDVLISSMPLKDLIDGMNDVPVEIRKIASGLPYRDYITIGVLLKHIELVNKSDLKTINNIIPDEWIYVQDRNVRLGRIQIYNNWSPYLVKDIHNTVWLGLEYFCSEGDPLWKMSDKEFSDMAIEEIIKLHIIKDFSDVLDYHIERVKKAYPAYFETYKDINRLQDYLDMISNLYCIGRNGQHRYNNMDHSMCTAFEAVKDILSLQKDKSKVWGVNTEKEYAEIKE